MDQGGAPAYCASTSFDVYGLQVEPASAQALFLLMVISLNLFPTALYYKES